MTPEQRIAIIAKLTAYLKRAPTETEIGNAPTDPTIMGWLHADELVTQKAKVAKLEAKQGGIIN